jgi:hypothetical protein
MEAMDQPSKFDPRGPVPKGKKFRPRTPIQRLLLKYRVSDTGCWVWIGTRNKQGYGVVGLFVDGRPIGITAPRLQWMHHHGEIPAGLVIRHTCDNPPCINPDHLLCGTYRDNHHDMRSKGRQNYSGLLNQGGK